MYYKWGKKRTTRIWIHFNAAKMATTWSPNGTSMMRRLDWIPVLSNAARAVQGSRGLIRSYLYSRSISVVKGRNKQKWTNVKQKVNKSNQDRQGQNREERKYLGGRSPMLCLCILFFINISHGSNLALLFLPSPSYSFSFSRKNIFIYLYTYIYIYIYVYKEMAVDTNQFYFHGIKRICLKLPQWSHCTSAACEDN